jgi:SnoaL-like domain
MELVMRSAYGHRWAPIFWLGLVLAIARTDAADNATRQAAPMHLTALDYIEIQQLSARYAFALETCTDHGYEYADLYTDDGTFAVSQTWGDPGKVYARGREALAQIDGGTPQGCRDPKTILGYGITHLTVDLVITPTPTGATGKSILVALGVGNSPTTIERQGGYQDVYVNTSHGWRIKSRVHVFPNMAESVQFGHRGNTSAAPAGRGDASAGSQH